MNQQTHKQTASTVPLWVQHAAPFVHTSASFIAMLAPDASKHLSRQEMQFAERAIAEYNALSYAERSNDPSTRQAITIPRTTITREYAAGCPQLADQAYIVHSWYGTGAYFHYSQCFVNMLMAYIGVGAGTAGFISWACALSAIGNVGCSEIAAGIGLYLGLNVGILYAWDATCNSQGVGITYVFPEWWHGSWESPSC